MELRPLKADDLFPMFNIISKIGLKEFKDCFSSDEVKAVMSKGGDVTSVGVAVAFDVASIIFGNIGKCKEDIYQFLSGLSGLKPKEVAELPPDVFLKMIVDVVKKEEFSDFFQQVQKLFS